MVNGEYGWHADGPGDITGDGLLDYLIGTRGYPYDAFAYSGTDGALVASYPDLGGYVAGVEDLTGDGLNDVLVGSALNTIVRVYGDAIPLVTDTGTISLSTGGTQNMRLIAAAHGLEDYLVIGSLQGTSPGYPLHSIVVPLNYDPVWGLFTVNNPNTGPLVDTYGQLDYWDQAFAGIQLPTGLDPSLVGLHLDHAFITLDATGTATFASNPVPLDLVP
ncbi:MAG: hypothetical protein O7B99_00940 [Planctomycetota bacterium]|nr:hypothetical protein [Planctomycetota bacterium]